ncbi:hypothetical protein AB4Y88_17105 [Paenarthrobacter sp. RAF9]|jgi:hypothetical protein
MSLYGSRIRRTSGNHSVGRPDVSLGRRAKITVEIANDGGASRRSATLAELVFTAFTSLRRRAILIGS